MYSCTYVNILSLSEALRSVRWLNPSHEIDLIRYNLADNSGTPLIQNLE